MAVIFNIPYLNPFHFENISAAIDPRYNNPQVYRNCSPQLWQTNDVTFLQLQSDVLPELKFYNEYGVFAKEFALLPSEKQVVGVTFTIYEAQISFNSFAPGFYYAELTYNDVVWQSGLMDIQVKHPDTILIEYTQKKNNFGIIFETGLTFSFRVEGAILNYQPGSDNELYIDQIHDPVNEYSQTFSKYELNLALNSLLSDWVFDLVNNIFAVQQKQIDGVYYERASQDSQLELTRQPGNQNSLGKLDIIPQNNLNLGVLNTSGDTINQYRVITDSVDRYGINGNTNVAGVFKTYVRLDSLNITNKSFSAVDISLGTTLGGTDVLQPFTLSGDATQVVLVNHLFFTTATLYANIPTGVDFDINFEFTDFKASPVVPTTAVPEMLPRTWYAYVGKWNLVDGVLQFDLDQFNADFDIATGLGRDGSPFDGYALAGTNNLPDMANKYPIGWDRTGYLSDPSTETRGTQVGDNNLVLEMRNLPGEGVGMYTTDVNVQAADFPGENDNVSRARNSGTSGNLNYQIQRGYNTTFIGKTAPLGTGDPVDNRPLSDVTIWYAKIN